jgi:hypothetical protein
VHYPASPAHKSAIKPERRRFVLARPRTRAQGDQPHIGVGQVSPCLLVHFPLPAVLEQLGRMSALGPVADARPRLRSGEDCTAVVAVLRPAVDHLLHPWMPRARVARPLAPSGRRWRTAPASPASGAPWCSASGTSSPCPPSPPGGELSP